MRTVSLSEPSLEGGRLCSSSSESCVSSVLSVFCVSCVSCVSVDSSVTFVSWGSWLTFSSLADMIAGNSEPSDTSTISLYAVQHARSVAGEPSCRLEGSSAEERCTHRI